MTTSPPDNEELQPPYLQGFVMILPDGIPIPDEATWTFETDELEPLLDDVHFAPTASSRAPIPSDGVGHNFVSLRFWQVDDESESPFGTDFRHLSKAFDRVHPSEDRNAALESSDAAYTADLDRHRTVVEAVTFVASTEDLIATATKPDPLTRCLDVLFEFHRAYRVAAKTPTEELTYSQLFPLVLTFRRALDGDGVRPNGIMHLASDNVRFGALTEHIGNVDFELVAVQLSRLRMGDPVMSFVERRVDARHELSVKGDFGGAIVQLAIACEVILDGLLGMVLWEGGVSDADAAVTFSADLTPRLKNEYAPRLGGNWALNTGILASWFDNVAGMRNRVVHGGYRPTGAEARRANESVDALAKSISDRLSKNFKDYPKTAWLFLGKQGFEDRNCFTRRVREWIKAQPPNAVLDWLREYSEWRDKVNAQVQMRRRNTP
ncbi:hypothetical protein [Rhodococcus artemisiae]|uniref:Apea-like HEPN domain-containing protein n=1 Tax=Rhodococcus artemisiae TaxID=714159 RepID=A0ABU7LIY3_9NOCA|nr:hypothetical protein [Rhodococcus artemisiae]MEE2061515.1 hypothetical protein [Rhodococcus artemisiae]